MNRNEDNKNEGRIPEQNSSKPMDSKRDVELSPDEKTDQDFPGYPHYPAKEDIMSHDSGFHRVDADVEGMAAGPNASGLNQRFVENQKSETSSSRAEGESDDLAAVNGTADEIGLPQNVSNEDLRNDAELPESNLNEE
ncbi:hypothetical protein [Flavisolibacter ginsenosidimutans]|uniref:Uncharacterized protein n=1 Tax=Flavisolibacter ginsenosidimutans TaxID=661481 RepID=A0A5B8UFA8_9BACT|nr:hypothetical protein [Flavisolibacter ginsenosidimutans]QEC55122.1 hypothetical protein FSB75_04110 [Flavisolibacter ginsenosidimutans]